MLWRKLSAFSGEAMAGFQGYIEGGSGVHEFVVRTGMSIWTHSSETVVNHHTNVFQPI